MALRPLLTVLLMIAVASVAACGRRGPLERPVDVQYEKDREAARKAGQPAPPKPSKETPERPFVLDGLID